MKYSLIGLDSNCFMILGYVKKAMKKEGKTEDEINEYVQDAESDDYQHLLYVSQMMIDKLNQDSNGTE